MNLFAYPSPAEKGLGLPLFARRCRDKEDAKKEILNNPLLVRVDHVIFKKKKYSIKEVYQW